MAKEPAQLLRSTTLPLPRFASLKSDKVYVRTGPAQTYPIKWIYKRDEMPVEITQEFDTWRKIRDFEGGEGWVHQSLLSSVRTGMVDAADLVPLHAEAGETARTVARLEPRVIARIEQCTGDWCHIDAGGYRGWVERKSLWGIYETEDFN